MSIQQIAPGTGLYIKLLRMAIEIFLWNLARRPFHRRCQRTVHLDKTFHYFSRKILHLWKFPVVSHMRTNFAEMPGKFERRLGAASGIFKGDAVVRVSRLRRKP